MQEKPQRFAVLHKLCLYIQKIINVVMILMMAVMTVVMFSQIVMRVVVGNALVWAEELLRFMFIWLTFLGLPVAIYHNDLTRFDLLQEKLSGTARKVLESLIYILIAVVLFFTAQGSFTLVSRQMAQTATSLPLKMGVIYAVIPFGAIVRILFLAVKLVLLWVADSAVVDAAELQEGENACL